MATLRSRCLGGEGAGEPDRAGRLMPLVGAQGHCPSPFPYGFPSPHWHRAPAGGVDRRWVRLWLLDWFGTPSAQ
jgi:hypothetical protein